MDERLQNLISKSAYKHSYYSGVWISFLEVLFLDRSITRDITICKQYGRYFVLNYNK